MLQEIIKEQREQILKKETLVKRKELNTLKSLLPLNQIISIIGVRRCGKSTLMKELLLYLLEQKITSKENILYLNLENPYFNQFKDDVTYLSKIYHEFKLNVDTKKKIFVFFDEVQFFKDWPVFIKHLYEKKEAKIILTGSNSKLLSSELTTLLSGRSIGLHLYPYSFEEFCHVSKDKSLNEYLSKGGFPEIAVLTDKNQIKLIAETYYKNIIYQDVIPRFGIKNSLELENISYYLISNSAKDVSYNTLKQISKLDDKTIKQYISYLEDANLLYLITNYDPSLKKQIGNKKKIYSVDFVFTNFLGFSNSINSGRLLENAVFLELLRKNKNVYFFNNGHYECDFIIKDGYKIKECIQVCLSIRDESTKERELSSLIGAMDYFKVDSGIIITENEKETIKLNNKLIKVIPFTEWAKD